MTPIKPALFLAASGLALTLAGCKVDNRPLLARSDAPPASYAALPQPGLPGSDPYGAQPYAGNLPPPPPPLPPARAYPYAERAYGLDRAFYQAPPDYGFSYADEEPWVWEAADDSLMFAEPYGDDYRFYYYEPGQAYPYFVRDADYGYAYGDNGALLALFDAAGALIGGDNYGRYYPTARQYWSRGYDLHTTFARAPRMAVDQAVWSRRAPVIARIEQPWMAAPERQPQWRQWRASAGPSAIQRYEAVRPARAAAADGRHDNGLHLGWDRGRHEGWDKHGGPREVAVAPPPGPRFEAPRGFAREEHGRRFEAAPNVQSHGREASFRAPPPAAAPAEHGRGRHGGDQPHGNPHFAQAAPQPAPQHAPQAGPNWTAAGDHGNHGPPPQAAQPQQGGGDQGKGHGGGKGGDKGQGGKGGGGDHGHGHGH